MYTWLTFYEQKKLKFIVVTIRGTVSIVKPFNVGVLLHFVNFVPNQVTDDKLCFCGSQIEDALSIDTGLGTVVNQLRSGDKNFGMHCKMCAHL